MKTQEEIKRILAEHKQEIREKYGVIIIGLFGSYARNTQNEGSDVDILVEIERPIGLKFFELWDELENLLGCKIDFVREGLIREEIKEDILKEVIKL